MRRSVFGTRGASDCAGCVGVALEAARVLVANPNLTLPGPAVFLFNGGEETVLQASHGFMAHSRCSFAGHQGWCSQRAHNLLVKHCARGCNSLRDADCVSRTHKAGSFTARKTQSLSSAS